MDRLFTMGHYINVDTGDCEPGQMSIILVDEDNASNYFDGNEQQNTVFVLTEDIDVSNSLYSLYNIYHRAFPMPMRRCSGKSGWLTP